MMGDMSDSPEDLIRFYRKMLEGYDCVFGSRFIKGGKTFDYPFVKLMINRLANLIVQITFGIRYNDTTNAFKCYRREVIAGLQPILSNHFNLTIELPLKAAQVAGVLMVRVEHFERDRRCGLFGTVRAVNHCGSAVANGAVDDVLLVNVPGGQHPLSVGSENVIHLWSGSRL